MTIDLKLTGTITALTPISITRPGAGEDTKGVPRIHVITEGASTHLPYLPAETMKGRLRCMSSDIASRISGQGMTLDLFMQLYKGGIKGKEKESVADLQKIVEFRKSHPVLGLYGAAVPRWLGGSLSIQHAMPADPSSAGVQTDTFMRIDPFKLEPHRLQDVPAETVEAYINYDSGKKERAGIKDQIKVLNGKISKLLKKEPKPQAEIDMLKGEKSVLEKQADEITVGSTIGRPLDPRHAIAVGSRFEHKIRVIAGTDEEVGLLLHTLEEFSNDCRIGGLRSTGHGYFRAEYRIAVRSEAGKRFEDAGSITLAPDEFTLDSRHPLIAQASSAWAARCANPKSLELTGA